VAGVDIMMFSDPRTVVHLACSPLLHYAFRVAKLRGCRTWPLETRIEMYGSTGRMRGRRARARTPRSCMTARSSHCASCCTAVIASTRVRDACAALHDAAHA
jgi:hypothetical protein